MTRPGPLAAYTAHEAEIAIARATAIRALTTTGATHDEAAAAVDEHLARRLRVEADRFEYLMSRNLDVFEVIADRIRHAARTIGDALARAYGQRTTQADVVLFPHRRYDPDGDTEDVFRAAIAAKRSGRNAGPRPPRMDGRRAA